MASALDMEFMRVIKSIGLNRANELIDLVSAYEGRPSARSQAQTESIKLTEKQLEEVEKVGAEFNALIESRLSEKRSRGGRPIDPNSLAGRIRAHVIEKLKSGERIHTGSPFVSHMAMAFGCALNHAYRILKRMENLDRTGSEWKLIESQEVESVNSQLTLAE